MVNKDEYIIILYG